MRISYWSSDVCSSDLFGTGDTLHRVGPQHIGPTVVGIVVAIGITHVLCTDAGRRQGEYQCGKPEPGHHDLPVTKQQSHLCAYWRHSNKFTLNTRLESTPQGLARPRDLHLVNIPDWPHHAPGGPMSR